MFFSDIVDGSIWWIFPLIMMVFCFFMMRGRMGSICSLGSNSEEGHHTNHSDSAGDILDKRYARGEMNRAEYEEKKRDLAKT